MDAIWILSFFLLCCVSLSIQKDCSYVVTDFSQDTCIARNNGDTTYYYLEDDDCIPDCLEYNHENGHKGDNCPCPPAYQCEKRCRGNADALDIKCQTNADCGSGGRARCGDVCVPILEQTCMGYHAKTIDFENTYFTAKFKPACENNGDWKAKQCKGGVTGRCFCFDKRGNRIFGQALYKDSDDMECACSRKRADLEEAGRNVVTFHCDSKGNYEPLQCDSGLCWCVEKKSGDLTSAVVPEKAMGTLPCYQVSKVGSQYLRVCDSIKYAIGRISDIQRLHGVKKIYTNPLVCDGDGAYGAYNVTSGIAQCIWRDGKRLGGWQTDSATDLRNVTCNCARDLKLYSHSLTCSGSGDYSPIQYVIQEQQAQYYCVDSDGFMKSEIFTERPGNCSSYY